MTLIVPYRSFEMWWSTTISSSAAFAAGSRSPRRAIEPQSNVTISSGLPGTRRAGSAARDRAGRGSAARRRTARGTTRCSCRPAARSTWCSASVEPSASPSGVTWHASATTSALRRSPSRPGSSASSTLSKSARHERPSSSGTHGALVDRSDDLLDPLALRDGRVLTEPELGDVLEPHLLADDRPQPRARRAQRVRLSSRSSGVPSTE